MADVPARNLVLETGDYKNLKNNRHAVTKGTKDLTKGRCGGGGGALKKDFIKA